MGSSSIDILGTDALPLTPDIVAAQLGCDPDHWTAAKAHRAEERARAELADTVLVECSYRSGEATFDAGAGP